MVCIYCAGKTQVVNSRLQKKTNTTWRRRQCLACKAIFTSLEAVDLTSSLGFLVSQNVIVPFSRDLLFISIYDSLKHRPKAGEEASHLCNTVVSKLSSQFESAAISRQNVIDITAKTLDRFDAAAATSYRAFHPVN